MSRVAVVAALLALVVVPAAMAATTKRLSATESKGLGYSKQTITVGHGKVTLKMKNPSRLNLEHSVSVRGRGVTKLGKVVQPGGTSTVRATLAKGTYTFYCHVSGHEAAGMKGKLVVM